MAETGVPRRIAESTVRCPCLSGATYEECCSPYHRGEASAPTAERLMRARYSAFALGNAAYLLETWHPSTRPSTLELDPDRRWFRLDILSTGRGGMLDSEGTVAFRASYRENGTAAEQSEVSRFVREDRRWLYVDGV